MKEKIFFVKREDLKEVKTINNKDRKIIMETIQNEIAIMKGINLIIESMSSGRRIDISEADDIMRTNENRCYKSNDLLYEECADKKQDDIEYDW